MQSIMEGFQSSVACLDPSEFLQGSQGADQGHYGPYLNNPARAHSGRGFQPSNCQDHHAARHWRPINSSLVNQISPSDPSTCVCMSVRLSNTSLFFQVTHTHMHTQVDGSLMVISDWPMTSWLVFNVLLHGVPDNSMATSGVSSCWVVEIRTLEALISTWGPWRDSEGSKHVAEDWNHSIMPCIVLCVQK